MKGSTLVQTPRRRGPAVPRYTETAPRPALRGRHLFLSWTATVTAGESVGFLVPAAVGVATSSTPAAVALPSLLAAGAVEGAVLGWAQARVLRRAVPTLRRRRWIALTAAGAVAAFLLGLTMTAVGGIGGWVALLSAAAGGLLLATLGGAQWWELRHHLRHAERWVIWTALAWLGGLAAFFAIAPPLWHPGQSVAAGIAIGGVAGAAMAGVQAAITGCGLLHLLRGRETSGRTRMATRTGDQ